MLHFFLPFSLPDAQIRDNYHSLERYLARGKPEGILYDAEVVCY